MSTLIEMATDIVSAHASTSSLTRDELVTELKDIFSLLSSLEKRDTEGYERTKETGPVPVVSLRKAFGKEQVTCMICGRQMKTLARHLGSAHHMKPGAYRKEFGIPRTQPLAARNYSEKRRQMAVERDWGKTWRRPERQEGGAGRKPDQPLNPLHPTSPETSGETPPQASAGRNNTPGPLRTPPVAGIPPVQQFQHPPRRP